MNQLFQSSDTCRFNLLWLAWACLVVVPIANLATPAVSLADETETESGDGQAAPDQPLPASDEGQLAMTTFSKPDGWEVELFAAEPLLANPVAFTVDNQGRVFVCESFRQDRGVTDNRGHDQEWLMADLAAQSVQDRIDYHKRLLGTEVEEYTAHDDRIRLLEDTNNDGRADRQSVFAKGFNDLEEGTGAGVLVRGNDVYYTCIPKLWLLRDTDGDGQSNERVALHDGYGVRVAFRGHDSHGLIIGPDGRLYFSIGDRGYNIETPNGRLKNVESGAVFRCELDGSDLEVFATGLRNPQELAFDDYGYLFTGDNNSDSGDKARWVNVMQGGDSGWRMMYQYLPDRGPFNREKIWHPYSEETPAYIVPPIANIGDGPSGLACYPGTGLTGDFANCFFLVDFRGGPANSGVRLIRTNPQGAFWSVERSERPLWSILATDFDFGPDGYMYVTDWVNGWVGEGKGRVYRFFDKEAQSQDIVREVQDLLATGFEVLPVEKLAKLLRHADRRIRLEAQWELAARKQLQPFVLLLDDSAAGTLARLHAVWGLGQTARLNPELREAAAEALARALSDVDLDVRRVAAEVVGDLRLQQFANTIVQLIQDPEPRVQYAACLAAGKLRLAAAIDPVCELLEDNQNADPGLRHAGIMALTGAAKPDSLSQLQDHPSAAVRLAAVVALRKKEDGAVAEFLDDANAMVQLEAARAVHDVPNLHTGLPQLAALIEQPLASEALARRVLNAHFRLGQTENAQAIAAFAGDESQTESMRIEALDMLATWAEPGKLDRVMNRYQPLDDREPTPAKSALLQHFAGISNGSADVQTAAVEAATALGLKDVGSVLRQFAMDTSAAPSLRINALTGYAKLEPEKALEVAKGLAADAVPAVKAAAVRQLANLSPEAALEAASAAVNLPEPLVRQAGWDTLARLDSEAATKLIRNGLQQYINRGLEPDVWLNVIEAAEGRMGEQLMQQLADFEKQATESDSLAAYRDCLFGGNPEAGKQLFFERTELSCVRCHKVAATGGEVGPDLTQIGKQRDNRYLLESIVQPDAKIAENYETAVLLTEDDQIITGVLRKETPSVIELIDAEGKIIEVDPIDVVSRKKGKSAMPADLLKYLTRRELRDLVAYLSSLKGE